MGLSEHDEDIIAESPSPIKTHRDELHIEKIRNPQSREQRRIEQLLNPLKPSPTEEKQYNT